MFFDCSCFEVPEIYGKLRGKDMSQYDYTMLKLAKMVSEIIARRQKISKIEAYMRFMKSETGKMLFDESTDMWHNGPDYIAEEYRRERYFKHHKKAFQIEA